MPFEPSNQGGSGVFVKMAELVGRDFDIIGVRGPMEGRFGEELKVDLVTQDDGEEKTVSIQLGGNSRDEWLKEAQAYLAANPTDTIPARVEEVETKSGNTFRSLVTAYPAEGSA